MNPARPLFALAILLLATLLLAVSSPATAAPSLFDNSGRMGANNLDMRVTNHGSFAYDILTGNAGLIYPRGSTKTAVFAAGPWIGALVGGQVRVALGEYTQEFTPGPMLNGTFLPDEPRFRCYTIVRGNTTSDDYVNWPVADGAPVDGSGRPLLLGDATVWSVYNDADPGVHTATAGSTLPLGLEVQQTIFAFNRPGHLGNTIFIKLKLRNRGTNTLDQAIVSLWSDPDLGGSFDDLVGCDTTLALGFSYNATNSDAVYGLTPPAVGFMLLQGTMTAFNKYIGGTDPANAQETYNLMRGLNADGTAIHVNNDPLAPVTTFQVSGDPVTQTGWLDQIPADRRLQMSTGPFTLAPGEEQEIVAAVLVGQGGDRLASVSDLRAAARAALDAYQRGFALAPPSGPPSVVVSPTPLGAQGAFQFETALPGRVSIRLFDVSGRLVRTVPERQAGAGINRIDFEARDDRGAALSAGVYFYKADLPEGSAAGRIVVIP